jgi:cell division protein FtsL
MPGELYVAAAALVATLRTAQTDLVTWFGDTISAQSIISLAGGTALIVLFATGRIVTISQLRRELTAQEAHFAEERKTAEAKYNLMISEKDARYSELREQRDYWQNAAGRHDARANKATEQLVEMNELARVGVHALTAFEEAASSGEEGS